MRPKASWVGLICRTHQRHRRQWLPITLANQSIIYLSDGYS